MLSRPTVLELERIVRAENVSVTEPVLEGYSRQTVPYERRADAVVIAETVDEIVRIVKLANKEKIPIMPYAGGKSTVLGHIYPQAGGIILDLRKMNRILEVNTEAGYTVIEPGVSFGQLYKELNDNYGEWLVSVPSAPPSASVLANYLERGGGMLGPSGEHAANVTALEVVLPTGEILRTGSAALTGCSCAWIYRWGCGPDLTGLFQGSRGSFGIVTKMGIKLTLKPECTKVVFLGFKKLETALEFIRPLMLKGIVDNAFGSRWLMTAELSGAKYPWEVTGGKKPLPKDYVAKWRKELGLEHEIYGRLGMVGMRESVEARESVVMQAINANKRDMELNPSVPKGIRRAGTDVMGGKPSKSAPIWAFRGGGFIICTGKCSLSAMPKYVSIADNVFMKYALEPSYAFFVWGGRVASLNFHFLFDKSDPDETKRTRIAEIELVDKLTEAGWIPYRPTPSTAPVIMPKTGRYLQTLEAIKKLLDPNGIMNPGNLCLW